MSAYNLKKMIGMKPKKAQNIPLSVPEAAVPEVQVEPAPAEERKEVVETEIAFEPFSVPEDTSLELGSAVEPPNQWGKTSEEDKKWFERACRVIPDGVQTMSKQPLRHVSGVYPIYLDAGEGAYVYDCEGNKYLDYPMGLGAILLGYNHSAVNWAIKEQLSKGTIFGLPNKLEVQLAEKLCQLIPSCEMVRFVKTGSEATMAAVKIARAYTGKDGIACCGYHGWSPFYSATCPKRAGTTWADTHMAAQFDYNDIEGMKAIFSLTRGVRSEVGTVIIEPYILAEQRHGFLNEVIEFAHSNGAVVIFDEVVTGFRTTGFSAQTMFNVEPDLTCLGKAMANGLPISAVGGKREIMQVLQKDCFVSSTFGGELLSIAAALATIQVLESEDVIGQIWQRGTQLKDAFNELTKDIADTKCVGYPCRTSFQFPDDGKRSLFWQECIKRGILFGYAQFICAAHGQTEIDRTVEVIGEALKITRDYWDEPHLALEGKPAEPTFRQAAARRNA